MAKYETIIKGNLVEFANYMQDEILTGSSTSSLEEKSFTEMNGIRIIVQAYERYSYTGGNRVSLTLTMAGSNNNIWVNVITTGGSQAMFFKVNTFGEDAFLKKAIDAISKYNPR